MDIIFAVLPKYLIYPSIFLRKLGIRIFYLKISGCTKDRENICVEKLKHADIIPLPLESLNHFDKFSEGYSDPEMKIYKRTQIIAPINLLSGFEKLYPNNKNLTKKLQVLIHSNLANQMHNITRRANIWARSNPNQKHILIDFSLSGALVYGLESNIYSLIIPFDIFSTILNKLIMGIRKIYGLIRSTIKIKKFNNYSIETRSEGIEKSIVAYAAHKGISYGNLYQKDLFYSSQTDSELHPEKILHFDYSGFPSPSKNLKWENIGNHRESWISNIYFALIAMRQVIFRIRHFNQIPPFLILIRSYVIYKSFSKKLESYPSLKIMLVDYDLLCPKELLLACEDKNIKTVAAHERFILSMNNLHGSAILSNYFCVSPFDIKQMKLSPLYCVDKYTPVGQYRSDILILLKKAPPPEILEKPISEGKKIIIALGLHTHMYWQDSQTDPLLNWSAHKHFLNDMINLSADIPDVYIVLRYKDTGWTSLPVFSEIIKKIESSENISISEDNEKSFFNYDLCAHSDLIIAKHTSLADECLSVGIPVIFHEYTHNTERIVSDAFDYSPTKIMCYNYQEILNRSRIILSDLPNDMTKDYEYLKNVVYGGLGDGNVKKRIHYYIQEILSSLD